MDPNDDAVEFQVNWGDGETTGWLGPNESRTLGSIEHAYEWFGEYWITARSRDKVGAISGWCDSVYVFVDYVVPVELSSFTARAATASVILEWRTASESNNLGFDIERSTDKIDWQRIGFVQGQGTTSETTRYNFVDTQPPNGHVYYRLKQMDVDGSVTLSESVCMSMNVPNSFEITLIYPNPFNASTRINYKLDEQGVVTVDVFSINGRHITRLFSDIEDAGSHSIYWDATDVPTGTYLIKISQAGGVAVKKCLLLK